MTQQALRLDGCRHDVLGHYLKAIGLLRVLARCADPEHRDTDAEGWWRLDQACFFLHSPKYPTIESIIEFFEKYYMPTPVFSAWNTGGGMNEKKEIIFSVDPKFWHDYWETNRDALVAHGFPKPGDDSAPAFPPKAFELKRPECSLPQTEEITIKLLETKGKKPKTLIAIDWSGQICKNLFVQLESHRPILEQGIKFTKLVAKKFVAGKPEYVFDIDDGGFQGQLADILGVQVKVRKKESGKKAVMAILEKNFESKTEVIADLNLGRIFFTRFQEEGADDRALLEEYREECSSSAAAAFDSIFTTRASSRVEDNPLFLNRGDAGAAEVFRSFWFFVHQLQGSVVTNVHHSLTGLTTPKTGTPRGTGSPFFPDTVKSYNNGSGWVEESFPFYPLDYILAVEGAFALRGSIARATGARSKRFAAFPFVFDSAEDMVDDGNETKGTAPSLWFPLWESRTTFLELASFIVDAQARLPRKEAHFSSEFLRALYVQGVDAGFSGWQEFRFKMKGSRVPWITTGRYVEAPSAVKGNKHDTTRANATLLNRALAPLDASKFMDQFDILKKGTKVDPRSPHRLRAEINEAIETAMYEPTPQNCLALLGSIYSACRQMCVSDSFRKKLPSQRATFFKPLPMEEWGELLRPLEHSAEFRISRAVASIKGLQRQAAGKHSTVEPILGSLLPLSLKPWGWSLPEKKDHTHQDVWTGSDVPLDLAAVLRRRYMDSLNDDKPALEARFGANLEDVLSFLAGNLDDTLIARWTEALSLVGWQFRTEALPLGTVEATASQTSAQEVAESTPSGIEPAYAALRTLLELECEQQGSDKVQWKKRRSQQPFSLLLGRSTSSLQLAVTEALRWISIWGVPNPWGNPERREKQLLQGRYVIRITSDFSSTASAEIANRLAAAVCIPLKWDDRPRIYQAVTIPPGV